MAGPHYVFESARAELDVLLREVTQARLEAFFAARLLAWPHPDVEADAGGLDIFEDLRGSLSDSQARQLVAAAIEIACRQRDPILLQASLELVLCLAETSGTTTLPPDARPRLQWLMRSAGKSGAAAGPVKRLASWFRRELEGTE